MAALACPTPQALAPGAYPNRPVRVIVAIPAGSGTDSVARLLAQGLSERLGRQFVVDNRPGAGTIIGNDAVAKTELAKWAKVVKATGLTPE